VFALIEFGFPVVRAVFETDGCPGLQDRVLWMVLVCVLPPFFFFFFRLLVSFFVGGFAWRQLCSPPVFADPPPIVFPGGHSSCGARPGPGSWAPGPPRGGLGFFTGWRGLL